MTLTLVVAVDGSEQSETALEHAVEVAGAADGRITVVHAVDPEVYSSGGVEPVADLSEAEQRLVVESIADAEDRGEEILDDAVAAAADHDHDVAVDAELLYGDPAEAITEYAEDIGADGIVVGHRGLSERYERLIGSVAKDLVEISSVPVTVVR